MPAESGGAPHGAGQALSGIRVIELGRVLAAPFCGQMLADAGADVIKIELPEGGDESRAYGPPFLDGQSYYYLSLNRNKRAITLNLKQEAARAVLRSLIATADVFLHNSLPGPIARLGFAYEDVQRLNPRIVYCAISGFGQTGPERDRPSLDMMAQAESGIMSLTGEAEGSPMRAGVPIADLSTGMMAAYGIMLALFQRQQTGVGQMVDTSLVETAISLLSYQAQRYFITNEAPRRFGNAHQSIVPYDTYRCADGWVAIAVVNEAIWHRFCAALGLADLEGDARFRNNPSRVHNRIALDEHLHRALIPLSVAELVARLKGASVPHAEVRDLESVFAGEQIQQLGLREAIPHPRMGAVEFLRPPLHLSGSPPTLRHAPPYLGEHNDEILQELGLDGATIEQLRREGAI